MQSKVIMVAGFVMEGGINRRRKMRAGSGKRMSGCVAIRFHVARRLRG